MHFLRLIIASLFQFGVAKDTLPVFLIDYDQALGHLYIQSNPFTRTGSIMFADMIEDALQQSTVFVIFVEEQFCSEDVSTRDENGTPFPNLHENLMKYKVKYLPNVVNPITILTRLMKPTQSNVFVLKPDHKFEPTDNLNFFYVFFKDETPETRIQTLRRHDSIIQEIYDTTRKLANGAVVGLYTGKVNPVMLTDYDHSVNLGEPYFETDQGVYVASEGALFRFVGMNMEMSARTPRTDFADIPMVVSQLRYNYGTRSTRDILEYLNTIIEFQGLEIQFSFSFYKEHWVLDNVTLLEAGETVGTTPMHVKVPIGRSYYCDEPLVITNSNDNSRISIPEYQIQPFMAEVNPESFAPEELSTTISNDPQAAQKAAKEAARAAMALAGEATTKNQTFGPVVKCNPYFDVVILTGLFISALLLGILLVGVVFLMNCQTNDRFDDPHGKPLVFSTVE